MDLHVVKTMLCRALHAISIPVSFVQQSYGYNWYILQNIHIVKYSDV